MKQCAPKWKKTNFVVCLIWEHQHLQPHIYILSEENEKWLETLICGTTEGRRICLYSGDRKQRLMFGSTNATSLLYVCQFINYLCFSHFKIASAWCFQGTSGTFECPMQSWCSLNAPFQCLVETWKILKSLLFVMHTYKNIIKMNTVHLKSTKKKYLKK